MNSDTPLNPREAMEVRVTALLLGELSAEEAAEVQTQIAAHPELAALHARLGQAIGLVREATALSEASALPPPPRLSDERRARLFAHFQSRGPAAVVAIAAEPPRRDWKSVVPLGLAAALIALLGGSVLFSGIALNVRKQAASHFAMNDPRASVSAGLGWQEGDFGVSDSSESISRGLVTAPEARRAPQSSVDHLAVTGNTRTRDKVIRREQAAASDDLFNTVRVDASKERLKNLNYFSKVEGSASATAAEAAAPVGEVQHWFADAKSDRNGPAPATSPLNFFRSGTLDSPAADASASAALPMPVPGPAVAAASPPAAPARVGGRGDVVNAEGTTVSKSLGTDALGTIATRTPAPPATPAPLASAGGAGIAGNVGAFADGEKMQRADRGSLGDLSGYSSFQPATPMPAEKPAALILDGSNAYSGSTTINGGTLEVTKGKPTELFGEAERSAGVAVKEKNARSLASASQGGTAGGKGQSFEFRARQGSEGKQSAASVQLAEQRVSEGRYKEAEDTLKQVLEEKPQDKDAIIALSRLEQPDYYNKTITPRFRGTVEEVKKDFAEAEKFYDAGRYDLALKRSEQVLNLDPYNIAARKLQEKVNEAAESSGLASNDELRSQAVRNLDKAWANPIRRFNQPVGQVVNQAQSEVSRTDLITRKLERIIIPKVEFKDATIREAIDFLREKSRALDTTEPNPGNRGVNFVLKLDDSDGQAAPAEKAASVPAIPGLEALPAVVPAPAAPSVNPDDTRITVSLTNIPLSEAVRYVTNLAGLKYRTDPFAVSIVPASVNTEVVVTKEFKVPPEIFGRLSAASPDDTSKAGTGVSKREAAKDLFITNGVTFGPGTTALYIPASGKLIVRNTQEQLDLVEAIVSAAESTEVPSKNVPEEAPPTPKPNSDAGEPQPEVETRANAFSTFSLNVSDVSFKLAAASLEQGKMPEVATVRSEEFINAFDYCDPEPAGGAPLAFATERARYPFAQNRDLLRLSVKTAAAGRQPGRALNLVLLLDNSGSMERADRVNILREALRVLCEQLQPQDKLSVVTFARTPRLWADGVAGDHAVEVTARVGEITPQGGTDLSAALDLGYATALRHYQVGSINRVVLLTDGAANLGDVNPDALQKKVEAHRQQGVALDCFGIGWEGLDDTLLEALARHGDGRYGFINTPEEAATEFAGQLAGALRVAASDVKVQVEWNPRRVAAYRQIGYAKHQLTKEQFRDNTVDAAEIGAAESGNALYVVEVNPRGEGDLATVRVRFKVPGTDDYREHEWTVPFTPNAPPLEQASPALRVAGAASAFSEWLVSSPYASEVTPDRLLALLNGVPATYGADPRPQKLEWMIRQAKSVSGR